MNNLHKVRPITLLALVRSTMKFRIAGESGSGNSSPFNCQEPTGRHRVNKTHNEETLHWIDIFFS